MILEDHERRRYSVVEGDRGKIQYNGERVVLQSFGKTARERAADKICMSMSKLHWLAGETKLDFDRIIGLKEEHS